MNVVKQQFFCITMRLKKQRDSQTCYVIDTQMNSTICNISIFNNSFISSPDIRVRIQNENYGKQINTCLIKEVVHIYWYIYKIYVMIFIKINGSSFAGIISVQWRRTVYEPKKTIERIKLARQISV